MFWKAHTDDGPTEITFPYLSVNKGMIPYLVDSMSKCFTAFLNGLLIPQKLNFPGLVSSKKIKGPFQHDILSLNENKNNSNHLRSSNCQVPGEAPDIRHHRILPSPAQGHPAPSWERFPPRSVELQSQFSFFTTLPYLFI